MALPLQFEHRLHRPGEIAGSEASAKCSPRSSTIAAAQEVCGKHDGLS